MVSGSSKTRPTRFQRPGGGRPEEPWQHCGQQTAAVSCFSFYANKTITTGEGGMAVTADAELAARMRLLSLHGLSQDCLGQVFGKWKLGLSHPRARLQIQHDGHRGRDRHSPARPRRGHAPGARSDRATNTESGWATSTRSSCRRPTRIASTRGICFRSGCDSRPWRSIATASSRNCSQAGVSCSVHWRPLHLHPYYEQTFGWRPADLPVASEVWTRLVSLPLFSAMRPAGDRRRRERGSNASVRARPGDARQTSVRHAASAYDCPGAAPSIEDGAMRVLMVTCEWPTPENPHFVPFIVRQVEFLRKAGVEIDVFSFRGARNPFNYLRAWYQVQKKLRRGSYDLIHAQWGQSAPTALPTRLPLVVTFRGGEGEGIVGDDGRYTFSGYVLRVVSSLRRPTRRRTDRGFIAHAAVSAAASRSTSSLQVLISRDFRLMPQPRKRDGSLDLPPSKRLVLFVGNPAESRESDTISRAKSSRGSTRAWMPSSSSPGRCRTI